MVALSASAVGFADALWLCPEHALSRFFASVSLIDPVALSPLLYRVFADGFRHWCAFRFCDVASPHGFGSVGPLGSCGGSTYIALHRTWLVSANLQCDFGAQVGVSYFLVRHSARIHGYRFVSFPDFCVSLPRLYHRVLFLGHLTRRVTGLTSCPPPRSSRTLSFALTYSHDSLILMHPCDRHSVAVSLSPSLTVAMTPCNCGALGGLYVLVGSLTCPSPGRMLEPSCLGHLLCHEAGLTYRPLLALPGLCLMPDL